MSSPHNMSHLCCCRCSAWVKHSFECCLMLCNKIVNLRMSCVITTAVSSVQIFCWAYLQNKGPHCDNHIAWVIQCWDVCSTWHRMICTASCDVTCMGHAHSIVRQGSVCLPPEEIIIKKKKKKNDDLTLFSSLWARYVQDKSCLSMESRQKAMQTYQFGCS